MANQLQQVLNRILQNKKSNLTPVNLREGVRCLGIDGDLEEGVDTTDATASSHNILAGETAYVNGEKVEGTMPNLGELVFAPSDEEHTTTSGYTDGIKVEAADITKLEEYKACLELAESVDTEKDFSDATAVASDIVKGKIAYAKGERLVGTLELKNTAMTNIVSSGKSIANLDYINTLGSKIKKIDGTLILDSSPTGLFAKCSELIEAPDLDFNSLTGGIYCDNMFQDCIKLTYVPNYWMNVMSSCKRMFYNCSSLVTAPSLNFKQVSNIYQMFYNCSNLINVPRMLVGNRAVGNMQDAFFGCEKLSDESLNNILEMIIKNETGLQASLPHTRTLKTVGLTQEQTERCKSLSNWAAFEAIGYWSTGY